MFALPILSPLAVHSNCKSIYACALKHGTHGLTQCTFGVYDDVHAAKPHNT